MVKPDQVPLVTLEMEFLLGKGAIKHIPVRLRILHQVLFGTRKSGGLHPILRLLNCTLQTYRFMILTLKLEVSQIQPEYWFVMVVLKDAYFQIEILPIQGSS